MLKFESSLRRISKFERNFLQVSFRRFFKFASGIGTHDFSILIFGAQKTCILNCDLVSSKFPEISKLKSNQTHFFQFLGFPEEDAVSLEKQFLKQCLLNRLSNLTPPTPKYESQIVVTRISITCNCGNDIKDGEICSKLQPIEKQKWTGFMGNSRNGLYAHL